MDTQTLILLVGAIVVVLILRAVSTKKVGPSALGSPQNFQPNTNSISMSSRSELENNPEFLELICDDKLIDAIKLVREKTNCDLIEAKNYVESLRTAGPTTMPASKTPVMNSSSPMEEEAKALIRNGQKIEAIKLVREKNGMDLSEAKDLVDLMELEEEG